ncbi:hypothetical protein [Gaopeijia maritima]|uniref:hypothetical protein n=1 Tax=Gaopeijia maritima TaxID=3119007 RepID=UPI0032803235
MADRAIPRRFSSIEVGLRLLRAAGYSAHAPRLWVHPFPPAGYPAALELVVGGRAPRFTLAVTPVEVPATAAAQPEGAAA